MPATLGHELARKAIHLASAAVPLAYAAGLPRATLLALLAAAGVAALGVEWGRRRSARVRVLFVRSVGSLLRAHEHDAWSGATWLVGAYALAVLLFPRPAAVAAMLAAAVGDAAAAIVGRAAAQRRIAQRRVAQRRVARAATDATLVGTVIDAPPGAKTWAGTFACGAATALAVGLVARAPAARLTGTAVLACAAAAAFAERPRRPFDDNVRIVLAAGLAALLAGG